MAVTGSVNPLMSLFPNASSAKSATKSVTQQAQQNLVGSLMGSEDTTNLSSVSDALVAKVHTQLDTRRKALLQRGSDIIVASNQLETAHTGTTTVLKHLQTIRSLVAQTTSVDLTAAQRSSAQESLKTELTKLDKEVGEVQLDKRPLLTGSFTPYTLQVGSRRYQSLRISLPDLTSRGLGLSDLSVTTVVDTNAALQKIDAATRSTQQQSTQQTQQGNQLVKSADSLIADLTRLLQSQQSLSSITASQQASQTQSNDLLSAFFPSPSLASNAQQLLL